MPKVSRTAAIVLRSKDPDALARFYREAFDFVDEPADGDAQVDALDREDRAPARETRLLALGDTHLRIEPAAIDAAPYPNDVAGWSPLFQHFALQVADIDAAMRRLAATSGWRPISRDGPERLPANTGGVTAFKFRDPDGHPLEFLQFPDRRSGPLFAGIDHSAISVADVERSIAFYAELGFTIAGRSLNTGIEQARLDGIDGATVDVVALRTPSATAPHLELLGYRGAFARSRVRPAGPDDVVATRLLLDADRAGPRRSDVDRSLQDPDGHRLTFAIERRGSD